MGYFDDPLIALLKGSLNLGVFLRVGTTPALHLSFLVNDIPATMAGLDSAGQIYQGGGRFQSIPALELMINGVSSKVAFALSGLDPANAGMVLDTAPPVLGALVTVGICPMDAFWQPMGNIRPLWTGTAEFISQEMKVQTDPRKPRVQSIMLTVSTGDSSRSFPFLQTFTDLAQKAMYPTDNFCSRVSRMVQTYIVAWPRF